MALQALPPPMTSLPQELHTKHAEWYILSMALQALPPPMTSLPQATQSPKYSCFSFSSISFSSWRVRSSSFFSASEVPVGTLESLTLYGSLSFVSGCCCWLFIIVPGLAPFLDCEGLFVNGTGVILGLPPFNEAPSPSRNTQLSFISGCGV